MNYIKNYAIESFGNFGHNIELCIAESEYSIRRLALLICASKNFKQNMILSFDNKGQFFGGLTPLTSYTRQGQEYFLSDEDSENILKCAYKLIHYDDFQWKLKVDYISNATEDDL